MKYIIFIFAVLLIAGCSAQPCNVQSTQYIADVDAIILRWVGAELLAQSSPRMSLAPAISALQEIRRETDSLNAPACAENVKTLFITYMDASIESYLAFLANESDARVSAKFSTAKGAMFEHAAAFTALKNGKPPYDQ